MPSVSQDNSPQVKVSDWELDFYSRPIIDSDGKKRWELLITSSEYLNGIEPFRWEKICPAGEVNSIWLAQALQEALVDAQKEGWETPLRLRCWRTSMKTMITKAAAKVGIEVIASRRTFSLLSDSTKGKEVCQEHSTEETRSQRVVCPLEARKGRRRL